MLTTYSGTCPTCGSVECQAVNLQDETVYVDVAYRCEAGHEFVVRYTCGIVVERS